MKILVSACLLGICCRYDGNGNDRPWIRALMNRHTLIPVCPEQLGGLRTPRPPVEWRDGRAMDNQGKDCTDAFCRGAKEALKVAQMYGCELAVLKARSPSCGSGVIYDGSFGGRLAEGYGETARLLREHGIRVIDEEAVRDASDGF